jgi:tRNA (cmo5U34)-methyltransferase
MKSQDPQAFFDQKVAAGYDQQWSKLAPLRETLNLLMGAVLADVRDDARILCVGVGTGSELVALAQRFPGWRFTGVEPSTPMLEVCLRKVEDSGVSSRCEFHGGYLDTLPQSEPFDAATSLLVSQFLLERESRIGFFREIAGRLRPGGYLVSSDLAADTDAPSYQALLQVWFRLMSGANVSSENLERMRAAYGRDLALLPPNEVAKVIAAGGFDTPILLLQTGLIHTWVARRPAAPNGQLV